jgi:hypothetical protein
MAAESLRPVFEQRLRDLGYGPLAIAHAFTSLSGPDTAPEALAELAREARRERSTPVPLQFEVVEDEPGLPAGHSLTITGVERLLDAIRIRYTVRPPLPPHARGPHARASDEAGHEYVSLGGFAGIATPADRTTGGFTLPLPAQQASLLRVRISWSEDPTSLWERQAHELRIAL